MLTFSSTESITQSEARYKEALELAKNPKNTDVALTLFEEAYQLDKSNAYALQGKISIQLKLKTDCKNDLETLKTLKAERAEFFDDDHMKKEYDIFQEIAFQGYRLLKSKDYQKASKRFSFVIRNTTRPSLKTKCLFLRGYAFVTHNKSNQTPDDFKTALEQKDFQDVLPLDPVIKFTTLLFRAEAYLENNQLDESYQDHKASLSLSRNYLDRYQLSAQYILRLKNALNLPHIDHMNCQSIINELQFQSTKDLQTAMSNEIKSGNISVNNSMQLMFQQFTQQLAGMEKKDNLVKKTVPTSDMDLAVEKSKQSIAELVRSSKHHHLIPEQYFNLAFLDKLAPLLKTAFQCQKEKDYLGMCKTYEKMLAIFPYDYSAHACLAKGYYELKLTEDSRQKSLHHYNETMRYLPPNHPQTKAIYFERCLVNHEMKHYQAAVQDFRTAVSFSDEEMMRCEDQLAKKICRILPDLERFSDRPNHEKIFSNEITIADYLNRAKKLFDQGRFQEALPDLQLILWTFSKDNPPIQVLEFAVSLFLELGLLKECLKAHNDFQTVKTVSIAKTNLAKTPDPKDLSASTLGEREEYMSSFQNKQDNLGARLFEKGKEYIALNKFPKALDYFNAAVELLFTEAKVYIDRGVAYALMGQKDKAAADYQKALSIDPKNNRAKRNLKFLSEEKKTELSVTSHELNESKLQDIIPPLEKTSLKFPATKPAKPKKIILTEDEKAQINYADALVKDLAQALEEEEQKKLKEFMETYHKKPMVTTSSQNNKITKRRKQKHQQLIEQRNENAANNTATQTTPPTAENNTQTPPDTKSSTEIIRYCLPGRYPMFDFEQAIIRRLKSQGADAYLCGSSVPARIQGYAMPGADSDIHTNATPEQIEYLLSGLNIYPSSIKGLYKIVMPTGHIVEVFSNPMRSHTATILTLELNELGEASTTCKTAYDDLVKNPYLRLTCHPNDSYNEDPQRVLINIYNAVRMRKLLPLALQENMLSHAAKLTDENQLIKTHLHLQKYAISFHCYDIFKLFFETKNKKGENIISKLYPHIGERLNKNADWILNEIAVMKKNPAATPLHFFAILIVSAWMEQNPKQKQETLYDIISKEPLFAISAGQKKYRYIKDLLELTEPLVISWKKTFNASTAAKWDPRLLTTQPAIVSTASSASQYQQLSLNK